MSLRQGPQRGAVSHAEATAAGIVLPDSRAKAVPSQLALPDFETVIPEGKFASRMAAESRALQLERKEKLGTSVYAAQIKGAWCVVRAVTGGTPEYVEG